MILKFDQKLEFLDLSSNNFNWVNFPDKKLADLSTVCSSCYVNRADPALEQYDNAIYTPYLRIEHQERYGCLYDEYGKRIEQSCLKQSNQEIIRDSPNYSGTTELELLGGKALYLGIFFGHYGHFLLESISRWWSLFDRVEDFDYYLIHLGNANFLKKRWIKELLWLAGIDSQRIIYFNKPIRIQSVFVPEASLQLNGHIFQQYRNIGRHLASSLHLEEIKPIDRPLYLSRRLLDRGNRQIIGEETLEDLLIKNGFYIVHPQLLSVAEQIYLFNRHKYIVGILGSALHNLIFSLAPKTVTYIASKHNLPISYLLLDTLFQNCSTYINAYSPVELSDDAPAFRAKYRLDLAVIRQYLHDIGYI
jgi:capsular polysaccharide biosynthesis protein